MKKAVALLTCALTALSLTACSQQNPTGTSSMTSGVATMAGSSEVQISSVTSGTASVSSAGVSSKKEESSKAASSKKTEASSKTASKASSAPIAKGDSPTRVMGRMLEAMKNDELDVALKYILNGKPSDFPFQDIPEAFSTIYTGIRHIVKSENIENDKAYVVIAVTTVSVSQALDAYNQEVRKLEIEEAGKPAANRLTGEKLKNKKRQLFVSSLRALPKDVTKESIVEMVRHESKWKVSDVSQFTKAFLGNLSGYDLNI